MSKKVKFYDKLCYISEHGYMGVGLNFLKINIFHVLMEALITLYLLESFVIFTKQFLSKPLDFGFLIPIICLPIIIVFGLGLLYSLLLAVVVVNQLYKFTVEAETDLGKFDAGIAYNKLTVKYQRVIRIFHTAGVFCYCIGSCLIAMLISYSFGSLNLLKYDNFQFVETIIFLGLLFGILWNLSGYFGNNRMDWPAIIKGFNHSDLIKVSSKSGYKFFLLHSICNIFIVTAVLAFSVIIFCNLHSDFTSEIKNMIDYSFFIIFFTSLFAFYINKVFSYYYLAEGEAEKVSPGIEKLTKITHE